MYTEDILFKESKINTNIKQTEFKAKIHTIVIMTINQEVHIHYHVYA